MPNAPVYHSPERLASSINSTFVVVIQNQPCNVPLDAFGNEVISQQQVNAVRKHLPVSFAPLHQFPYPSLVIGIVPAVFFEESVGIIEQTPSELLYGIRVVISVPTTVSRFIPEHLNDILRTVWKRHDGRNHSCVFFSLHCIRKPSYHFWSLAFTVVFHPLVYRVAGCFMVINDPSDKLNVVRISYYRVYKDFAVVVLFQKLLHQHPVLVGRKYLTPSFDNYRLKGRSNLRLRQGRRHGHCLYHIIDIGWH